MPHYCLQKVYKRQPAACLIEYCCWLLLQWIMLCMQLLCSALIERHYRTISFRPTQKVRLVFQGHIFLFLHVAVNAVRRWCCSSKWCYTVAATERVKPHNCTCVPCRLYYTHNIRLFHAQTFIFIVWRWELYNGCLDQPNGSTFTQMSVTWSHLSLLKNP